MKKRFRKISHGALALVLTLCMLIACVNVGTIVAGAEGPHYDAGGTHDPEWHLYLSDGTHYYYAYNVNITIDVTSARLSNGYLKVWIKDNADNHYGNQEKVSCGGTTNAANNVDNGVWLENAGDYSSVTIKVWKDNNTVRFQWVSGTLKTPTYAVNYGVVGNTGGSVTATSGGNSIGASGSTVAEDTSVTFTATPATNYVFDGWFDNSSGTGTAVSPNLTYTTTITAATNVYAKFHLDETLANTYYTVTYSTGSNGTVAATAGGNDLPSGSQVKYGTQVTFTATPSSGYTFSRWTGSNTGSTSPLTLTAQSNINLKGWFTAAANDGTNGSPYFVYATDNGFPDWANGNNCTGVSVKYKNGRAYGYIENPVVDQYYYFSVFDTASPKDDNAHGIGKGAWTFDVSDLSCVTEFDGFVTTDVSHYHVYENNVQHTVYMGKAKANDSRVSRLIIDLGNYGSSFSFDYDTFRVIPVYDTDSTNVDIYAKDSVYRGTAIYDYFYNKADTVLTGADSIVHHNVMDTGSAARGTTITVTTTIDSSYRNKYYVKGFSFNGVTPSLHEWNLDGVYTETYTIPADFPDDYLEITPIYYYYHTEAEDDNYVQFYIENYDETIQATGWGSTLFVYPYYSESDGTAINKLNNAFGGYPGQPVINYGGRRFVEIPTTYTRDKYNDETGVSLNTNVTGVIKGVTLSNGYWDIVHREYVHAVPDHKQTYDYDDFYKIYKETSEHHEVNGKPDVVDQITFAFKYRTTTNNFSDGFKVNESNYQSKSIPQPYASFESSNAASVQTDKFQNGWEPLLDYFDRPIDLFGKQLTKSQQALDPVIVVSDDYKITYAGYYATTWTVYARVSSSDTTYTKIAEIAPSALIVTSTERLGTSTYPAVADAGDGAPTTTGTKLADYSDEYTALKTYAERPVLITYESAIENNSSYVKYFNFDSGKKYRSEVAIRSDGRWMYSYYNDNITANIRIDYKNSESTSTWTTDEFRTGTNTGTVTGASAYFTNTEFNGATTVSTVSSATENFAFTATETGGYVFQGWWLEKDGIATRITENDVMSGVSGMTSNATFVARYVKSPTGTLTINHTLASTGSTGGGTTYINVVAKKTGESDVILTNGTGSVENYVANQFIIPSTYVYYNSGWSFDITLKTVADDFSTFNNFSEDTGNNIDIWENTNTNSGSTSGNTTTTTFTVSANALFTLNQTTNFPEQTTDILNYFSALSITEYKYVFTYNYPAYVTTYGGLGYTVRGTFKLADLNKYMEISNGELQFKSTDDKNAFLNLIAPFEDNFMTEITWNTDAVTPAYKASYTDSVYTSATKALTATINANNDQMRKINLNVILPYENNGQENKFDPTLTNGKATMLTDPMTYVITGANQPGYGEVYSFNTVKSNFDSNGNLLPDGSKPELLTAPEVIYQTVNDVETAYYFRYWSIMAKSDKHEDVEYTRSYNYEFDYVLFQDSTIEPIYEPLAVENEVTEKVPTPVSEWEKDETGVTITFMENSRNQYNEDHKGNITTEGRTVQGDRIYTDFLLSYNNVIKDSNEKPIQLNKQNASDFETGLVIEYVAQLPGDGTTYYVEDDSVYKDQYGYKLSPNGDDYTGVIGGNSGNKKNAVETFITAGTGSGFLKSTFAVTDLNNKNRINYYYNMPNRNHSNLQTSAYQNKLYRAYTYIIDKRSGSNTVYISDVPVYFTIYEMGSIQNYSES